MNEFAQTEGMPLDLDDVAYLRCGESDRNEDQVSAWGLKQTSDGGMMAVEEVSVTEAVEDLAGYEWDVS